MTLIEAERARPQTGGKDSALRDWVRALEATAPIAANPQRILPRVIEELAETRGDAPALLSARECLTYRALAERANRYARWALGQDLGKGDTVCLIMPNRPEYLAIWLGITKVGGVVSLINTNLRGVSARPLPRHRRAEAHHRRRRTQRRRPRCACAHGKPAENLVARQRRVCPHRSRHRKTVRRTAEPKRNAAA